jgi:Ca2+-binding EF-hand superfamily protein
MEAFAALKLKKKQEAQAKALALEEQNQRIAAKSTTTYEEKKRINQILGFAEPPQKVFALGKDGKAAVWWFYQNFEGILGWEVIRYRKDRSNNSTGIAGVDEWQNKGSTRFDSLPRLQVIIDGLSNDFEYRFTVQAINFKGSGIESLPSNEVVVEAPLPSGWYRFYDKRKKKHYYASLKTSRSSWTRPELDPFFLEDEIYKNFTLIELQHLKGLFVEDMEHFRKVTLDQFMDMLQEIGENCSKRWILQLFQAYATTEHKDHLKTWQDFMSIINHIKSVRMKPSMTNNPFQFLTLFYNRTKIRTVLQPKRDKMGLWVKEINTFAGKEYYRHVITGECSWILPDEIKFYLAPKFEQRLLKVFDYGQIEGFKQHFALLDIDNSGDLSDKEIRILLRTMGINVSESKLEELIKAIDVNGNGSIEFDEFCYLMFELCRKDKGGVFKDLKSTKNVSLFDSDPDKRHDTSSILGISDNFNFQKVNSAAKELRDSQSQYAMIRATSLQSLAGASASASASVLSCCSGAKVSSQVVPMATNNTDTVVKDGGPMSSKLNRQVSFDAKVTGGGSVSSKGSSKKSSRRKNKNEYSDDESDLSESEDENEGEERSIFITSFSRGSSKKDPNGHGPYCMCGCRRDVS